MAVQTLYGFLVDDALRQSSKLDLSNAFDQGYGVLTGEPTNYFVDRGIIGDTRRSRLQILDSKAPFGSFQIVFDQKRFDMSMLQNMTDVENAILFNIIERIYLQQEYSDSNIEHQLTSSSSYSGYVPNSFAHATEEGQAKITDVQKIQKLVTFRDWYSFDFSTDNVQFRLHFWVANRSFAKDYPYTTITRVIPPYEPKVLSEPAVLVQAGNLQILTEGSAFIFDQSNIETVARDQNGIYTYSTKYVIDSQKTVLLPFALAYCGAKVPSSLECRKAIRDYLEENTTLSQEQMEILFPELYVNSRFFIVPLYDVYTQRPDRDVYNSIMSLKTLREKASLIFDETDAEFREQYLEILLNAQNKMWCVTIPDQLNDQLFSILEQHPTYQDYSSQVPGWKWMESTTQEFAGKLIRCFSVLNGESVSSEFIRTELYGKSYLSFTAGKSEYLVMEKDSYLQFLKNI